MSDPVPVSVVNGAPIPVAIVNGEATNGPVQAPLPPTTTAQQDLTTAGQRHINVMWEGTQKNIALMVTAVTLLVCAWLVYRGDSASAVPAFMLLSNVFFLVVGTYFQRTNHTKTGGVGSNDIGR